MRAFEPLVKRVPWMGKPFLIATLWTMYRSRRKVRCELHTHPDGWELRLTGKHTFPRTQTCSTAEEVLATQERWRATLERDGWSDKPGAI